MTVIFYAASLTLSKNAHCAQKMQDQDYKFTSLAFMECKVSSRHNTVHLKETSETVFM